MSFHDRSLPVEPPLDQEELAAQDYMRRRLGHWSDEREFELRLKLEQDPAYADAYARVERSWGAVGQHAASAELMAMREQAIFRARRASARRWLAGDARRQRGLRIAAGVAAMAIALAASYQLAPFGFRPGEYRTSVGERHVIELEDHSRVELDATTSLRVRYSKDARVVQLLDGQAQFTVARDPARPFKVVAGSHTIIALGTVFTVEYIDREFSVAMLEGKVAVVAQDGGSGKHARAAAVENETAQNSSVPRNGDARQSSEQHGQGTAGIIEIEAGEALRVPESGQATVVRIANLAAATAWREGKVIFHEEPLSEAVRRLNRYSRLQIEIADPTLASMQVSGVFEAGDAQAFADAVQVHLPATVDYSTPGIVSLRANPQ